MIRLNKILFLGNSITLHEPKPEFGWTGNWGMAASEQEHDYVHALMRYIYSVQPKSEFKAFNIADFEKKYWEYDFGLLARARSFGASTIIMRIGDNVDDSTVVSKKFEKYYKNLVNYFNPVGTNTVICTSCFWDKLNTNQAIKAASSSLCHRFIDIHHLSRNEENMAIEKFWHKGVCSHPSDTGMARIAALIWDEIVSLNPE